jgi:hypothetical protein
MFNDNLGEVMKARFLTVSAVYMLVILLIGGCSDKGNDPTSANQQPSPPPVTQDVSFQSQIRPIFQQRGCDGCHGGNGGLFVQTIAQLLQGGSHGPVIVPGKADSSNLIKKLSPNPPFGDRMPQGGPYLPDSTIQMIRTWINQGAKNN